MDVGVIEFGALAHAGCAVIEVIGHRAIIDVRVTGNRHVFRLREIEGLRLYGLRRRAPTDRRSGEVGHSRLLSGLRRSGPGQRRLGFGDR
jgi:hypothetical protein